MQNITSFGKNIWTLCLLVLFLSTNTGNAVFAQVIVVRPLFGNIFQGNEDEKGGISLFYFSMGKARIDLPNHTGLSYDFADDNLNEPRYFQGSLPSLSKNEFTTFEFGLADIHTKRNFVVDLFNYSYAQREDKHYRMDRISTGIGFQIRLGNGVWLRQTNYISMDWMSNILIKNIDVDSPSLWLNEEVFTGEGGYRLLIRQNQFSVRPQLSLVCSAGKSFLLSFNAGYSHPFSQSNPKIILKPLTDTEGELSRFSLSADRINLRDNNNNPIEPSSFRVNGWYTNVRLGLHIFNH